MLKVNSTMTSPRYFVRLPSASTDEEALDLAEGVGGVGPPVLHRIPAGELVGLVEVAAPGEARR